MVRMRGVIQVGILRVDMLCRRVSGEGILREWSGEAWQGSSVPGDVLEVGVCSVCFDGLGG